MKLLVCGLPRSGTSWVAEVLGQADQAHLVTEPDHPLTNPVGGIAVRALGLYPVIARGELSDPYELIWDVTFAGGLPRNRATSRAWKVLAPVPQPWRDPFMSMAARAWSKVGSTPQHVVAKTVTGLFALEWIADRYQAQVVVTKRNVLSVIGSWMRLGFLPYAAETPVTLPEQPTVRSTYLEPLGLEPVPDDAPLLERVTFHVGLMAAHLDRMVAQHPDWPVVRHEQYCLDPERRFRELYDRLSLGWSARVSETLRSLDTPGSGVAHKRVASQLQDTWRGDLDPEQLTRVQSVLSGFGSEYPSIVEAVSSSMTPSETDAEPGVTGRTAV